MLRLLIRITTENPSAWIIFIISRRSVQCFVRVELPGKRKSLIFNSISITLLISAISNGDDVCRLFVYVLIDLSVWWVKRSSEKLKQQKKVSIVSQDGKMNDVLRCYLTYQISIKTSAEIWMNRFCNSFCKLSAAFVMRVRRCRVLLFSLGQIRWKRWAQVGEKSNTT